MQTYVVFSYYLAKQLINAGYRVHHIEKNRKEGYEGMIVFYFFDDGTIDDYVKKNK